MAYLLSCDVRFASDKAVFTTAYAREMADYSAPRAMRALKRQVWDAPLQTLHAAVMLANRDMIAANTSPDFKEDVASFMENRKPNFHGIEEIDE